MKSPGLRFLDPVKSFELFPYAKDGPDVCEQSELQSQILNQNIVKKNCQLIKALYSKFHPGGWAVTPAGQVIVCERIK